MSALFGRRVLAIGANLAPLAQGPLFGVILESAGPDRLASLAPGAFDLVLIDADGLVVGRLAAIIANHLRGKHKTVFTPPKAPFFNAIEVSFTK